MKDELNLQFKNLPLPDRQSIRYKGFDYRGVGYYHVTICCHEKKCRFGKAYKSIVFHECLKIYKSQNIWMGKLWQRNYWERIIRNEDAYYEIGNYIINNPRVWHEDKKYVDDV